MSVAGRRGHFSEADEHSVVASLALSTLERMIALEPRVATNLLHLIVERLKHALGVNGFFASLIAASTRLPDRGLYHWFGDDGVRRAFAD